MAMITRSTMDKNKAFTMTSNRIVRVGKIILDLINIACFFLSGPGAAGLAQFLALHCRDMEALV
jgi:hypothetical protein